MRNLNLREELTEKEVPLRISKEKVRRLCKSSAHTSPGSILIHTKEVFSDGWTKYICHTCGQVKFTMGITVKEGM